MRTRRRVRTASAALLLRVALAERATVGPMRKTFLALIAAAALSGCASGVLRGPGATEQDGRATDGGAAFMGYHGPVWRGNAPSD